MLYLIFGGLLLVYLILVGNRQNPWNTYKEHTENLDA